MKQGARRGHGRPVARVQTGITNLAISAAVGPAGFFFHRPDPRARSPVRCGHHRDEFRRRHCLKYGVTVNNVLGVKMVMMDGSIVEIGGAHLDGDGYDFLALVIGSEGQLGIVTEATVRILRQAEGARPMLIGFESTAKASICCRGSSRRVSCRCDRVHGPSAIEVCEAFAKAGYPLNVEALLIVEVEGSE